MNFSIVGIQVVKTYFKKQSTEVVIWKIQIKNIPISHLTPDERHQKN